ncbi:MAG: GntR family transcriptional regulator [Gammaproteobacteria bacterium]
MIKGPSTLAPSKGSGPLRAPTFVDHVMEAIISRAVLGEFQAGRRINELALARELGVSRAPVREALRMLVALDVVENTPYQGMRLADLPPDRVLNISKVRLELEKLSLRIVTETHRKDALLADLKNTLEDMKTAARREDRLAIAKLDADFHEAIMRASGNPVLLKLWQMLRPQLIIIFARSKYGTPGTESKKPFRKIIEEHRALLKALAAPNLAEISASLESHIMEDDLSVDFSEIDLRLTPPAKQA